MAFNGFTIFILAVIGAVAFFHYTQGFFSATISVVICVLAAVLAVSYHEQVAGFLMGMMPNLAHPVALLLMFAIIYLVLRTIIDSMVPGNVRLPAVVDKAGAAVMGLVAGVFAAGLVAFAAQAMPVGPSLLGYSRFAVEDRETSVPVQPRSLDRGLYGMLNTPSLDAGAERQSLIVPVDDILLNTVQRLSEGGSLASGKELTTVHPAWLTELFAQRLGIEPGGKRVALPEDGTLEGLYTLPSVVQRDHEFKQFQRAWPGQGLAPTFPPSTTRPSAPAEGGARTAAARVDPTGNQELVIARVMFKKSATDKDRFIRFSPGSVRLVARKSAGPDQSEWVNYLPIGTYDPVTKTLWRNRPDDFLFLNEGGDPPGDKGVDLAFYINRSAYVSDSKGDAKAGGRFAPGSFLEIKRQLRFDLASEEVVSGAAVMQKFKPSSPQIQVLRKPNVVSPPNDGSEPVPPAPAPQPAPAPAPSPTQPAPAPAPAPASGTPSAAAPAEPPKPAADTSV